MTDEIWILSVGNELLIGKTVNTNLSWLGGRLTEEGFFVRAAITVRDDCGDVSWALRQALGMGAGAVITTGGLGPTFDDKTLECVAEALGLGIELNRTALEMIRRKYRSAGMELNDARRKMALMPVGGRPLPNPVGTAPGCALEVEEGGTIIFSLPGVPSEMRAMFEGSVLPDLRERLNREETAQDIFRCEGIPESAAAPIIEGVMAEIPGIYVKSHPMGSELGFPILEIHVQSRGRGAKGRVARASSRLREGLERIGGRILLGGAGAGSEGKE